jgi:hypothetical protein
MPSGSEVFPVTPGGEPENCETEIETAHDIIR